MQSIIDICVDGQHKKYDLNSFGKDIVGFGRSSECDIQIPKNYISRVHGCFYLENGQWFIRDMESTNGIYFNGNKIQALRMGVGTLKIAKNSSSQDFITISMPSAGYSAPTFQTPQQPIQQQYKQQPMQQQYKQQQRPMNSYGSGVPDSRGTLRIIMIIVSSLMGVACFLPFFGVGGGWDKYLDAYTSRNMFTSEITIFGILMIINALVLLACSIFNKILGLNITALIISIFCPIITIIALVVVKGGSFGVFKASWGFYLLLVLGIASIVLAAINLSKTSKIRKESMPYRY